MREKVKSLTTEGGNPLYILAKQLEDRLKSDSKLKFREGGEALRDLFYNTVSSSDIFAFPADGADCISNAGDGLVYFDFDKNGPDSDNLRSIFFRGADGKWFCIQGTVLDPNILYIVEMMDIRYGFTPTAQTAQVIVDVINGNHKPANEQNLATALGNARGAGAAAVSAPPSAPPAPARAPVMAPPTPLTSPRAGRASRRAAPAAPASEPDDSAERERRDAEASRGLSFDEGSTLRLLDTEPYLRIAVVRADIAQKAADIISAEAGMSHAAIRAAQAAAVYTWALFIEEGARAVEGDGMSILRRLQGRFETARAYAEKVAATAVSPAAALYAATVEAVGAQAAAEELKKIEDDKERTVEAIAVMAGRIIKEAEDSKARVAEMNAQRIPVTTDQEDEAEAARIRALETSVVNEISAACTAAVQVQPQEDHTYVMMDVANGIARDKALAAAQFSDDKDAAIAAARAEAEFCCIAFEAEKIRLRRLAPTSPVEPEIPSAPPISIPEIIINASTAITQEKLTVPNLRNDLVVAISSDENIFLERPGYIASLLVQVLQDCNSDPQNNGKPTSQQGFGAWSRHSGNKNGKMSDGSKEPMALNSQIGRLVAAEVLKFDEYKDHPALQRIASTNLATIDLDALKNSSDETLKLFYHNVMALMIEMKELSYQIQIQNQANGITTRSAKGQDIGTRSYAIVGGLNHKHIDEAVQLHINQLGKAPSPRPATPDGQPAAVSAHDAPLI